MTDSVYGFIKKHRVRAYLVAMLLLTFAFYALCIINNAYLKSILFFADRDTFMDYFHCLPDFVGYNPYTSYDWGTSYPAGAVWVFKILHTASLQNFTYDYGDDPRAWQSTIMVFMLFYMVCIFIAGVSVRSMSKLNTFEKDCLYIIILISMPAMFAYERGNVINLAFSLTIFFVAFVDHENKYVRMLAYIALAFAASIKIYPAIFGFYVIKKRGLRSAVILAVTGVIVVYLTYLPFGGFKAIAGNMRGMFLLSGNSVVENDTSVVQDLLEEAVSYDEITGEVENGKIDTHRTDTEPLTSRSFKKIEKGSLPMGTNYCYNLAFKNSWRIFENITGIKTSDGIRRFALMAGVLLLFLCAIFTRSDWKELMCYGIVMIVVVPFSAPYTLLFLIIPFIAYLNEIIESDDRTNLVYGLLFAMTILPYVTGPSVPGFEKDGQWPLPYRTLINIILLAVFIVLLSVEGIYGTVLRFRKAVKNEKDN